MVEINPDRLLGDLHHLRNIGRYKTGVHRPTFSPQDVESRHWFQQKLADAGLDARIDGIGNVIGYSRNKGPALLLGSHIESQNHAGWLDGALGVIYGLEAARALRDDTSTADLSVDVAAWCDEEGHFGTFLGSRSFLGLLSEDQIDKARNKYDATPLRDALQTAGFAGLPRELIKPARYKGYVEAHIEQGDQLDTTGLKIGVVTAIVAIWQYRLVVTGQQNHAGTTGMERRRDAGLAMVRVLAEIDKRFPAIAAERSVWTTGRIVTDPGGASIIPGRAEALFQFRDVDPAVLTRMRTELRQIVAEANAAGRCPIELETLGESTPMAMDEGFQQALEAAASVRCPGKAIRMPSGAGHDAQYLAGAMPAAMMFVPSIGGISHHWSEDTAEADIVLGAQVYCDAVARILR
jgi:N-carbamoyl-L-amino-acid hydrolase